MKMIFDELLEFQREFKKLEKKYKSLPDDFGQFCRVVEDDPDGKNKKHFSTLFHDEYVRVVKARFFCLYLKRSSLRIVYAYAESEDRVDFIELYYKGDKENEDGERVERYLKERVAVSSGMV
ncbi:MAG: hypothetical protein OXF52_03990 [Candidatus Dadabacteria bacterium]|nr:hypothetical protein [Candidatus Dadabacteria bacterium]